MITASHHYVSPVLNSAWSIFWRARWHLNGVWSRHGALWLGRHKEAPTKRKEFLRQLSPPEVDVLLLNTAETRNPPNIYFRVSPLLWRRSGILAALRPRRVSKLILTANHAPSRLHEILRWDISPLIERPLCIMWLQRAQKRTIMAIYHI